MVNSHLICRVLWKKTPSTSTNRKVLILRLSLETRLIESGRLPLTATHKIILTFNLEARIAATYAKGTKATSVKSLYDSYIKAFSWASDCIGAPWIVGFITNANWIDKDANSDMKKCFEKEFSEGRRKRHWNNDGRRLLQFLLKISFTLARRKFFTKTPDIISIASRNLNELIQLPASSATSLRLSFRTKKATG